MTREELRDLIREVIAEATADMKAELAGVASTGSVTSLPTASLETDPELPETMIIEQGLLTERHLNTAARKSLDAICVAKSVVVTPLARDAARSKGIRIERID